MEKTNDKLIKCEEWIKQHNIAVEYEKEAASLRSQLAEIRKIIWINHGHTDLYGDDGEIQCLKCSPNWDYKNGDIVEIVQRLCDQLAEKDKEIELIREIANKCFEKLNIVGASFESEHRIAELFRVRAEKAEAELAELKERMKGIEEIYNVIESDFRNCYNSSELEVLRTNAIQMWQAIQKAMKIGN